MRKRLTWALAVLCGAVFYYAVTRLGSAAAHASTGVTEVWPATGVALALVWFGGPRLVLAVLIGELAGDLTNGVTLTMSLAFAATSGAEATAGYAILRRVRFRAQLDRARDVLGLMLVAAPVSTAVGAGIGSLALLLHGDVTPSGLWSTWHVWWMTDMIRDLVMAPLLFVAMTARPRVPGGWRSVETIALLLSLALLGVTAGRLRSEEMYLIFPILIWAALRFRQRGAVLANAALATGAIIGAAAGASHLARVTMLEQILFTRGFVAVGALTTLVLAALMSERERDTQALRRAETQARALGEVATAIAREQPLESVLELVARHAGRWREAEARDAGRAARRPHAGDVLEGLDDLARLAVVNDRARRQLVIEATTDPLTGLHNRRAFGDRLTEEIERARRYGRPLALILIDLDGFKAVNDAAGHAAGDRVLTEVAIRVESAIRIEAMVARLGGDELAIILPESDSGGAYVLAERVREAVCITPMAGGERITISAGIAELDSDDGDTDVIAAADAAVYAAKRMGGNASVCHTPGMSAGEPVSSPRRTDGHAGAARSA